MTEPDYLTTTRTAYDTVAVDYARLAAAELDMRPLERGMLAAFAEIVRAAGNGPVADIGCGPGRLTVYLDRLGLSTFGIDLSSKMIEVARQTYPNLRFSEGSMTEMDLEDGELGGIVAWYSIIHTPPELLPVVFAEFHRTLAPGGHLLMAFQVGNERLRVEQAYGHEVSCDAYRLPPDLIAELLNQAGFVVSARLEREAGERERTPQACLLARKPER
ncbi:class I SAM-dependent methyltransferase [Micromonospora sonneratiae]|uniref:Class I SAM-dependent methyltransferase n=1 Tax=Micromonospora sonneratiae TaxID=1184706 RepID=A0ABW3YEB3_9ACTN